MKARSLLNAMVCIAGLAAAATAQAQNVVISAVYGGANATSALSHDFVELRNRTNAAVDISGWSLQYSSATGTSWANQKVTFATGSIVPANGFYLIRLAAGNGTNTVANITNFDATANFNYSGTNGKLALVNNATGLALDICPADPAIEDKVSYGTGNCPEGTAVGVLSVANGAVRLNDGCTDTNNNSADFTITAVGTGVGQFFPRYSGSAPAASCGGGFTDCNGNSIDDAVEIVGNPALDCDGNGGLDSCQIIIAPALDCDSNGTLDSCQIAGNSSLDCDGSGGLDACQILANPALDANSNGVLDSCEVPLPTGVIISEVVDGTLAAGLPKYVELTNLSNASVTFGANDAIKVYANGAVAATYTYSLSGLSLAAGQSYVIANNGGSASLPPAGWLLAYGISHNPDVYGNPAFINGNDAITIERNSTVLDAFGVAGVDGTGTAWEYMDSYARRKPGICTGSGTFSTSDWIFGGPNGLEKTLLDGSPTNSDVSNLYVANLMHLTSPGSHANTCNGNVNDCNGNSIDDSLDIAGGFPDCNANGVPDACDILAGALDCNANGIPDNCDIISGAFPDTNATGIPDVCDSFLSDCNGNFIEDATEIAGGAPDCNANGVLDECEPLMLVDADGDLTADLCDGAYVAEADTVATVRPAGVRPVTSGTNFFNIEGSDNAANASYGGTRFDITNLVAQFDDQFGESNWHVERVYVRLVQSNAAFTLAGGVSIQHTNNDAADFVPTAANHPPIYADFEADFGDAQEALAYAFAGTPTSSGTVENYVLFDASGSNLAGGQAIADEINSASGPVTMLFRDTDATVAATYAGTTSTVGLGPTLVVFAAEGGIGNGCAPCAADFDNNGGIDGADLGAFFAAYEAGEVCGDVDQNGGIDGADLGYFFSVYEAGGC